MPDVMSAEKRKALMSRIRNRNTSCERAMFLALRRRRISFRKHFAILPRCTPDIVIPSVRLVVFVHGDFWHGWRFPQWSHKLQPFWREKIALNRARDGRNKRALRRRGWATLTLWEHQVESNIDACVARVEARVVERRRRGVHDGRA